MLERRSIWIPMLVGLVALCGYTLWVNAWLVDDAYITFRTVDNFVAGRGMTWNPGERVQAFTHPLWMLLLSALYAVTHELFVSSLLLSMAFSVAAMILAAVVVGRVAGPWASVALLALLLACKAFVDFTSSGLENPLTYLVAAGFFGLLLVRQRHAQPLSARDFAGLGLLAALSFVNRFDTILLYAPALAWLAFGAHPVERRRRWAILAVALSPIALWLLFSTFYFGFPFPNTYYAKVGTGVPLVDKLARGVIYARNSWHWDTAAHLASAVAVGLAIRVRRQQPAPLLALAGVGCYYVFVLFNACTTHMAGRFFAAPLFVSLVILASLLKPRVALGLAAAASGWLAWSPMATWKMGGPRYHATPHEHESAIDTNAYVHREGMTLLEWRRSKRTPQHRWYTQGLLLRDSPVAVRAGGAWEAVGYYAFAAGPHKTIVDIVGLTDPLLARLPACNVADTSFWKSGHFYRWLPAGYMASMRSGTNAIEHAALHEYYDHLRAVIRGPLWSGSRLTDIVGLNLGRFTPLLAAYRASEASTRPPATTNCKSQVWDDIRRDRAAHGEP